MLYMLWDKCIPESLYKHVCKPDNFICLNGQNVFYTKTAEIVFLYASDINNYREFQVYFERYFKIYQYVNALLFPIFYVQNDAQGIDLRGFYILHFKEWSEEKKKKKKKLAGKNPKT